MRHTQIIAVVLAVASLGAIGIAQTSEKPGVKTADTEMVAARRADLAGTTGRNLATPPQYPPQMHRPPMTPPPAMGYPGPSYAAWNTPRPSGRHALIGAGIGFALGALAGSRNSGSAALAVGLIGAGIGGGIGVTIPEFPHYRHSRMDDYEEDASMPHKTDRKRDDATAADAKLSSLPPSPGTQTPAAASHD